MAGKSAWELFELGGPFMWPLLGLSILALAIALDRLASVISTWESFDVYVRAIRPMAMMGDWDGVARFARGRRPLQLMTRWYIATRRLPERAREELLKREGTLILDRVETRLLWLGIIGQLAPMLGLAGTVLGLVMAFEKVESHGGAVQASLLAGGIWQALITTVAGLAIAIPSLVAFYGFQGYADRLAKRMGHLVSYLDEWTRNLLEAGSNADGTRASHSPSIGIGIDR